MTSVIYLVTLSYNIEKDIEGSGINNIIQHNYYMLTLCITYSLYDR